MFSKSKSKTRGVTLIEILIVIAIFAILSATVVTGFKHFSRKVSLDKVVADVRTILNEARTDSVSGYQNSGFGVRIASTTLTLFKGSSYSGSVDKTFETDYPIFIYSVDLENGGTDVVFEKLTGRTTDSGIVVIHDPQSYRYATITIYATGIVE